MARRAASGPTTALSAFRDAVPLLIGAGTLAFFHLHGDFLLAKLADPLLAGILFAGIFPVMLWASFGVARHADTLAELLGEPYGTLILTFAVIVIEVSLIAAIMLTGDATPSLARDTMLAALMIVLNGLVGGALLIGGLVYKEQEYNLAGARAFISVLIPLAVLSLILPVFTVSTDAPTFTAGQALFFGLLTALLYAVFLAIQTGRHKVFFVQAAAPDSGVPLLSDGTGGRARAVAYNAVLLVLTLLPIVLLSKRMATLVDYGTAQFGAPAALGGIVVACLVLTPEGIAALKAAHANHLQRSVNLLLGTALSTIGLTVPAVLAIGLLTGQAVILGVDEVQMVLLVLTLLLSSITFGGGRTNLLQGAVHLVIFFAYLVLIFSP